MPAFFLELFSEEIPARMQARAAENLARLVSEALAPLTPRDVTAYSGTRRIAVAAEIEAGVAESRVIERGPRTSAPEQALAGFLRKHGATKEQLTQDGDNWVLERIVPGADAADTIAKAMPALIRRFPWPKSMRWGGTSTLTWVRPLRRIICLIDGEVVPFDLRDGADDGHGLASANQTEGHRFLSPGPFTVSSATQWRDELRARHVIVDAAERRAIVAAGVAKLATEQQCTIVDDPGLLDEVAGLVEWPVPLLGRIGTEFMDLPAEVMQVSMRVNQRYFAVRNADGSAAPYFAFAANIEATDGGATIIAGNERVLRARFSDARHFWDLDRARTLESRVAALDAITFHAKIGTQGQRVARIVKLAGTIAELVGADPALAERAALLSKADLTTGMVGEFPELQGVIGGYYARHDGEHASVAEAVRDHYAPKGQGDEVPTAPVAIAVALADKLDTLAAFFAIGEKPTGSGDPFALRRAGLGVIRIIRENNIRVGLRGLLITACDEIDDTLLRLRIDAHTYTLAQADETRGYARTELDLPAHDSIDEFQISTELLDFLAERLRVQLRAEGARHDVLAAILSQGIDDDLTRLLARTNALAAMLATDDGANLLAAAKRAANILRIEDKKDGPHDGAVDPALFAIPEEESLAARLDSAVPAVREAIRAENFTEAMTELASLRQALDAFFASVTVNDARAELRANRLRLLSHVRSAMNLAADFSKIDG
jgi:glycyl-tRNA synthetase beta chain